MSEERYGKKNVVKIDPLKYNICLLGESKIGKTTIMKEFLEELVGEDGYMFFEMFGERGADAISDIVYEDVDTWAEQNKIIKHIKDNRNTIYKDLKTIVIDTYDGWIKIAEEEVKKQWNKDNPDKRTKSINAVEGGFQKGQQKAFDMMFEQMYELIKIGISVIIIGHVKNKENIDIATGNTYNTLTSDVDKIYFSLLKKKMHFIGIAYYDRDIVTEKTGKKNIVTKKDITVNKISAESRKIKFRDDNLALDSGSRFADIAEEIPFDAYKLIDAMKSAIKSEFNKSKNKDSKTIEDVEKEQEQEAEAQINERVNELNEAQQLEEVKEKIKAYVKENQKNRNALKLLLDKSTELKLENPISFSTIEEAKELLSVIQ
jgi:hypothetical protein